MNRAKIRLSKKEQRMVQDAGLILTKNQIMKKARLLLEELQYQFIEHLKKGETHLTAEVIASTPKISRGENYLGLPFLILDYPRCFEKETVPAGAISTFAIRTMFWWGNFFSITLHLSGTYKKRFGQNIIAMHSLLEKEKYFVCVSQKEWDHHFDKNNYARVNALSKVTFGKTIQKKSFLKIAYKIPLSKWEETTNMLFLQFKTLTGIANQLPRR